MITDHYLKDKKIERHQHKWVWEESITDRRNNYNYLALYHCSICPTAKIIEYKYD